MAITFFLLTVALKNYIFCLELQLLRIILANNYTNFFCLKIDIVAKIQFFVYKIIDKINKIKIVGHLTLVFCILHTVVVYYTLKIKYTTAINVFI